MRGTGNRFLQLGGLGLEHYCNPLNQLIERHFHEIAVFGHQANLLFHIQSEVVLDSEGHVH